MIAINYLASLFKFKNWIVQKVMIEFVKESASIGGSWISGSPPKKL